MGRTRRRTRTRLRRQRENEDEREREEEDDQEYNRKQNLGTSGPDYGCKCHGRGPVN